MEEKDSNSVYWGKVSHNRQTSSLVSSGDKKCPSREKPRPFQKKSSACGKLGDGRRDDLLGKGWCGAILVPMFAAVSMCPTLMGALASSPPLFLLPLIWLLILFPNFSPSPWPSVHLMAGLGFPALTENILSEFCSLWPELLGWL